jgi:Phosphotransferase enzyme family
MSHHPLNPIESIDSIARQFHVPGDLLRVTPHGSGHINDTYAVTFQHAGTPTRFILQRINHNIFTNPPANIQNIQRVTAHLAEKLSALPDRHRRVLTLVPTHEGNFFYLDPAGNYWRMYNRIEDATTYDAVETLAQAFQAGRAFGQFQHLLADLPAPPLLTTIPDFDNTPKRFAALEHALHADVVNRAIQAAPEIAFAVARKAITPVLLDANLPLRVTHNDTKLNNVLLDNATGEAICVIDLDTVMPGLALYDFGDMVRTTTSPAREDERDLSRVIMQLPMFESLLRGYLSTAGSFLTPAEREHLAFSGKLITFHMGIRFLADYLAGDTYYKVHRPTHNLDRCRTQFALVRSVEQQEDAMQHLVESLSG